MPPPLQAPELWHYSLQGPGKPSLCWRRMAPQRGICQGDPAAAPRCTRSSSAESAVFQDRFEICASHTLHRLSPVFFSSLLPPIVRSPGCQMILPLPAPPCTQLLQKRHCASLWITPSFFTSNCSAPAGTIYFSSLHAAPWGKTCTG